MFPRDELEPGGWYLSNLVETNYLTPGSVKWGAMVHSPEIDVSQSIQQQPLFTDVYKHDNESVVNSSSQPDEKLHKRHTALSFHRVREAIASGMIYFYHVKGEHNPADILSKHWGYSQVWLLLKTLLFWKDDTARLT